MATPVVLIAGDGIGPEVAAATRRVVEAAGADLTWVEADAGLGAAERFGDPLPEATLDLIRRYRVALKGPCTTPVGKGFRSINVRLRKELDLFASVRPVNTLPGVNVPYSDVNLVVVRENTEGLYSGPGARRRPRRGRDAAHHHARRGRAHRPLRLRAGPLAGAAARHLLPQGRRAAAERRPVPQDGPRRGRRLPVPGVRGDCTSITLCMQLALDPIAFRRAGDGEPVRRRDQRPVRRPGRRPGPGAGVEPGCEVRRVRGGPRQCPGHRRQGAGQSDRAACARRR